MELFGGNRYNNTSLKSVMIITGIIFLGLGFGIYILNKKYKDIYDQKSKKKKNSEKILRGYLYIKDNKLKMTKTMNFLTSTIFLILGILLIISGGVIFFMSLYKAISPVKSTPCTGSSSTNRSGFFEIALAINTL